MMDEVDISADPLKGRTLIAKRSFTSGDVVFEESPIVSCQFPYNQDLKYLACDHCMAPLETAKENLSRLTQIPDLELPNYPDIYVKKDDHVRCDSCLVVFCSRSCRQTAIHNYHPSICACENTERSKAVLDLRKLWQTFHYPPEESTIMLVLRIYATIHQAVDKNATIKKFEKFMTVPRLEKHGVIIDGLYDALISCVGILQLDVPESLLTKESFARLLALLAMNSQGIATCSFATWIYNHDMEEDADSDRDFNNFITAMYDRLEDTVGLDFLNNEGAGLYPIQSKMSHSCEPNTEVKFPNSSHVLAVRALNDIAAGEELTFSYIDECDLSRSRHTRQKIIKEKFLFDCVCHRCVAENNTPDLTSESDMEAESD